ncbi:hypothetical protein F4861DRAFT_490677 [Xylaria intraflava]|nr:hypothetical protein F4861DRAFT_490677 [Xylaria intraflava]
MGNTVATTSVSPRAVNDEVRWQSRIYQAVMTPVNFVTFLVSLYFVDTQYRARRHRQHESNASISNGRYWLHKLLYRQEASPYDWVDTHQTQSSLQSTSITLRRHAVGAENPDPQTTQTKQTISRYEQVAGRTAWFYQTKQTKLFKTEADDAFALRNPVLLCLCALVVAAGWALWRVMVWLVAWGRSGIV